MAGLDDFIDQNEIDEALKHDADVLADKLDLANRAADFWRSVAPVEADDHPERPPGTYRDSIQVEQDGDVVAVVATDELANIIEYGSARSPEFACRARTEAHFNSENR